MAKIPVGDFGFRSARIDGREIPIARAPISDQVGRAVEELGHAGQRIAAQQMEERRREEDQARRNKMAASFAQYQVDIDGLQEGIGRRLQEGQVTREDAEKEFGDGLSKLKKTHIEGLDPNSQAALQDNLIRFDGAAQGRMRHSLTENAKQERAGNFTNAIESLERLALTDRPAALNQAEAVWKAEGTALYGAAQAAKQMQGFRERVAFADFANQLNNVRDSAQGLTTLEAAVQKDADLDPDKKNVLTGRIKGFQESLAAKAERAERSRLATLDHQVKAVDNLILKGFPPSIEQMAANLQAAKGTPYEEIVREQIRFVGDTSAYMAMRPAQQEAELTRLESAVRARPTPEGVREVERYRSIYNAQQQAVKEDPISFAAARNLAAVQPLDLSKPDQLGDQLQARLNVARGMKEQYGSPLRVLTKEEAGLMNRFLQEGTTEQKTKWLSDLSGWLDDREAYSAMMQQIAPDSPVTAVAGSILGKTRPTVIERNFVRADTKQTPREVGALLLEGERLLNPTRGDKAQDGRTKGFPMPKEEDFKREFSDQVGRAFAGDPQGADTAYQAVKAYYAGSAAREGNLSGDLDRALLRKSLNAITGGIVNYNGRGEVLVPWGMDEPGFKDAVRKAWPATVKNAGLDEAQWGSMLPALGLQNLGDSRYLVRNGTGYLLGKNGRPVEVNLSDTRDSAAVRRAKQVPQ